VLNLRRQIMESVPTRIGGEEKNGESNRKDPSDAHDALGLVHLVVADGGFDAQRSSTSQEQLALPIVVCQTAAALTLLKPGGNFVLKMFGFQLDGTKRVLQHLYDKFERMTFVKPVVSRPASAERYLVCCGYDGQSEGWDGLLWRKEILNEVQCSKETGPSTGQVTDKYSNLNALMDSFDIRMLQLNIHACQSILDHLHTTSRAAQIGDASTIHRPKEDVNLQTYERIWQLW
jgi:cap1 methyltransferase